MDNLQDGGGLLGAPAGGAEKSKAIGTEEVRKAMETFRSYKDGKKNLEESVKEAEQWYKQRHWDYIRSGDPQQVEPTSGWLFNAIANKHADAMDNYPMPNILPREESDKQEAERLSAIVPVVLEQCDFEGIWDSTWDSKLRGGTGIYGVFWNSGKLNGLGDIDIQEIDIMNLFWEPGITDIQKSRNFFSVELVDLDLLQEQFPEAAGQLAGDTAGLTQYEYEDKVDTSGKVAVYDWYYKKKVGSKTVLHYCKFVGDIVLFATENQPQYAQSGWYDHGLYPFCFDPLFKVKASPCGFGMVHLAKSAQEYIDKGNQAFMKNLLANAKPRYLVREDGQVNEDELADTNRAVVHCSNPDAITPLKGTGLPGVYANVQLSKVEELKETTGNRDVSTGGSASGVTAASAIAAMQEAGSKLSRDANKASYRVFRGIVQIVVELIRQFYSQERSFRITGKAGNDEFVRYSNAGIQPQRQSGIPGQEDLYRKPLFDISISAQKQSPYSKLSQNEMSLQFYNAGFFNPQLADQALACLEMMDFDRKQTVINKVRENGTMYQHLQQLQQQVVMLSAMVDKMRGSNLSASLGGGAVGMNQPLPEQGAAQMPQEQGTIGESPVTKKARQQVAESTAPV